MKLHQRDNKGLNVPSHQIYPSNDQHKHELVVIPSDNQSSLNSYFTITVREKSCTVQDISLKVTMSGVDDSYYLPICFAFSRIEIVINGKIFDTLYPEQQFLAHQFWLANNEKRNAFNVGVGQYFSTTNRTTETGTSYDYYFDIWSFFKTTNLPLLFSHQDVQIRCYTDSSSNIFYNGSSAVTTGTMTSCSALVKLTRLTAGEVEQMKSAISRVPRHFKFHELRQMVYQQASGTTSSQIVLSGIVGPVSSIFFIVRSSAPVREGKLAFTKITSFEILNNASTNIVGGQVIPDAQSRYYLSRTFTNTDYLAEDKLISNSTPYAYLYSWSLNAPMSEISGNDLGHHKFTGSESLKINYASSLGSAVQIDIFAMVQSAIEISSTETKKISV